MNIYLSLYKKEILSILVFVVAGLISYGLMASGSALYILVIFGILLLIFGFIDIVKCTNVPTAFRSFDLALFRGTIFITLAIIMLYKFSVLI